MKRALILHLLFFISAVSIAQQEYEVPRIWNCPYPIDRKEIQDSGYKNLFITRTIPIARPKTNSLWVDTIYSAVFDSAGYIYDEMYVESAERFFRKYEYNDLQKVKRIFEEKHMFRPRSVDTTIISFGYKIGNLVTVTYLQADRGKFSVSRKQEYSYDKDNRLVRYCKDDDTTFYYYNDRGLLTKEHEKLSPRYSFISTYNISQSGNDSIVKITTYEIDENKMDSVYSEKRLDSAGRIIYVSRELSKTYRRTFRPGCIDGENFRIHYKYDINELRVSDEVSYADAYNNYGEKWSIQVVNNAVTVTTWLSEKSNLYYKIQEINGRSGTGFIRFDYYK